MKIVNTESGKPYQLFPDTELSVERTNPFFNDYGEQTLPVSLPDSEYNRSILNQPGMVSRKNKVTFHETSIQDGEYFVPCRQAILSVTPDDKIETSFYMNDGSFYSRLENTYMTDVFGEETVQGVNSLDQAINFIKSLFRSDHPEFAIFQVEISNSRYINVYQNGILMADQIQTEKIDDKVITIPRGFYLSPFLKATFVLKRLFSHFGYTLLDSLFTQDTQFRNMVFINNVADAVVTGKIYYSQLLPNISCKEMLELFRKKFLCEFVADEVKKTVQIVFFNDLLDSVSTDLSGKLVGKLAVEYPSEYRQIILQARDSISEQSFDSIPVIKSKYPTVQFNPVTAEFYVTAFSLGGLFSFPYNATVADASQRYYEGGNLPAEDIEIPECLPVSRLSFLYIGDEQFLNSSLVADGEQPSAKSSSTDSSMHTMLAFAHHYNGSCFGTVTNYIHTAVVNGTDVKIGDYSLAYNGDNGIFEKFYRRYDTLLRNSLHTVKGSFLLNSLDKSNIPSVASFNVNGTPLLLNRMAYKLGTKHELTDMEFLTLQLYEPVSTAKTMAQLLPDIYNEYKWVIKEENESISADEYDKSPYKDVVNDNPVFPPVPTGDMVGKRFFEVKLASQVGGVYLLTTTWLEVVRV